MGSWRPMDSLPGSVGFACVALVVLGWMEGVLLLLCLVLCKTVLLIEVMVVTVIKYCKVKYC